MIAVLVIREFYATVEVSQLRAKVRNLVHNEALATAPVRIEPINETEAR